MEKFMKKYSLILTLLLEAGALVWLMAGWKDMDMVGKLPVIYIAALAIHEIEELKFPGGFVELVISMTGIEIKNIGAAKLGLFLFTIYVTVIPAFISGYYCEIKWTELQKIYEKCRKSNVYKSGKG